MAWMVHYFEKEVREWYEKAFYILPTFYYTKNNIEIKNIVH